MTRFDLLRKVDDIIFYVLILALAAVMVAMAVPGILYITTDQKATVELAASTNDPAFRSWLASNNYELVSAETSIRGRGLLKVKIRTPDKE